MGITEFVVLFWDLFEFALLVAGAVVVMWAAMEIVEWRISR